MLEKEERNPCEILAEEFGLIRKEGESDDDFKNRILERFKTLDLTSVTEESLKIPTYLGEAVIIDSDDGALTR